jgi:hypothetical protein
MLLVIGPAMTCPEAANESSKTTGLMDLTSKYRFVSLSVAKKDGKNVTDTTETDKEEVRTKKPAYHWKGSSQIAKVSSAVSSGKMRPHRELGDACFVNRI